MSKAKQLRAKRQTPTRQQRENMKKDAPGYDGETSTTSKTSRRLQRRGDEKWPKVTLYLPADMIKELKKQAVDADTTLTDHVHDLLVKAMK